MTKAKRMKWTGQVARMVQKRNACRVLAGTSEGNRPLRILRCRWEDNIKMVLKEIGWDGMDWIHVAQKRDQWRALVNTIMNLGVL
jgi:hypothetical protein